jgi:hypothetical protein
MQKEKTEPEVTVLGKDITKEVKKQSPNEGVEWGIFLIFAGIILFLNTLEILPWEVWNQIVKFWPILIIMTGLRIIIGQNIVSRVLMILLTVALFGSLLIFVLLGSAPQLVWWLPENIINYAKFWRVIK